MLGIRPHSVHPQLEEAMRLNRQQMLNRVWEGLALQGFEQATRRSNFGQDGDGNTIWGAPICAYEGADGKRCAVGWLDPTLTNANYQNSVDAWQMKEGNLRELVAKEDVYFMERLQSAHDRSTSPLEMRANLVELAQREGLTLPDGESQPSLVIVESGPFPNI